MAEEVKNPDENLENRFAARIIVGIATGVAVAAGVAIVCTALLPVALARAYGPGWLAAYPATFAGCALWARHKR